MKINEIFLSIEGEGKRTGLPSVFVRTHGCDLKCSYCDSYYACVGDDYTDMSVDKIISKVLSYGVPRVTLTGGEPLIHNASNYIIHELARRGLEVNVETNGHNKLDALEDRSLNYFYTMDWKSISSNMSNYMLEENLSRLTEEDVLKFVVGSMSDLDQMLDVLSTHNLVCQVYVSPVFGKIDPKDIVKYVLDHKLNNVHVQVQLHKVIWDPDKRGV